MHCAQPREGKHLECVMQKDNIRDGMSLNLRLAPSPLLLITCKY